MSTPTSPERPRSAEVVAAPPPPPAIPEILTALSARPVRAADVAPLSDLDRDRAGALAAAWSGLPAPTREAVVRAMDALTEERLDVNFGRALRVALGDESAPVRQLAVAALWEDEAVDLVDRFVGLVRDDLSQDVRAEAAKGLARFAALAAAGDLDEARAAEVRGALVGCVADESEASVVRRRALESVGVFGRDADVRELIRAAFEGEDESLQAGALYAMGASLDPRWLDVLLAATRSPEAEVRYEAARACGLMGDARAVGDVAELALEEDAEVRHAAIAALGAIGGRGAVRTLDALLGAEDARESDVELIEAALEEAAATVEPLRVGS